MRGKAGKNRKLAAPIVSPAGVEMIPLPPVRRKRLQRKCSKAASEASRGLNDMMSAGRQTVNDDKWLNKALHTMDSLWDTTELYAKQCAAVGESILSEFLTIKDDEMGMFSKDDFLEEAPQMLKDDFENELFINSLPQQAKQQRIMEILNEHNVKYDPNTFAMRFSQCNSIANGSPSAIQQPQAVQPQQPQAVAVAQPVQPMGPVIAASNIIQPPPQAQLVHPPPPPIIQPPSAHELRELPEVPPFDNEGSQHSMFSQPHFGSALGSQEMPFSCSQVPFFSSLSSQQPME